MNNKNYGPPFMYDYYNTVNGSVSPSTLHAKNTALASYFSRYLLQEAISVFKWNLPDNWNKDYFLYCLYCYGFIAVCETDKFGVICQGCGLQGYDVYYQPTNAVITNPLLKGILTPRIHKECTLFKLQPNFSGIMDIVGYYADLLAIASESAGVNFVNSKLAYIFTAANKTVAESYKEAYDRVASGETAVVLDKSLERPDGSIGIQMMNSSVSQTYIADKILSDMQTIMQMFYTDIGLPNSNLQKRERMISDEVNANNVSTLSRADMWLENLKEVSRETNDMFGTNISVEWRAPENKAVMKNDNPLDVDYSAV